MADLNTGLSAQEVLTAFDNALHPDAMPTVGSEKPVESGGVVLFVNSSVATNTANFIGTFNSVEDLEAYSGVVTNNDYAFVIGTDSDGNTVYNRYKYNGSAWVFEYALNNSSFTAAQWATIQSGLTASDKTKLDGIEAGANKTVVDANLSETSTNPVQNKTVNAALSTKQDTIADLADIRSGAAAGATAVQQTAFETDQARQETEIGVVANAGAKNLLKITATSQTIGGVTFTVNDDQTVTVNGTNDGTGASAFMIVPNEQAITIPDGNYILSGCPASGGSNYDLRWYSYSQGKSAYDTGAGALVTKDGNTKGSNIAIVVKTGQTANNLIFKPMIRHAEITDDTFVPYAPTNRELYEMILALQG